MSTLFSTLMSILNHVQRARLFGIGFSNKEILAILTPKHNVVICVRTLKRLCRKLRLYRRLNQTNLEDVVAFMQTEIDGNGQNQDICGYTCVQYREATLYRKIQFDNWSSCLILRVLNRDVRLGRRHDRSKGPDVLWHTDGYDQLKPFALHSVVALTVLVATLCGWRPTQQTTTPKY